MPNTTPRSVVLAEIATREGERVDLAQAAAFGALTWPVWVDATYDVSEVAPARQGRLCDDIFGI